MALDEALLITAVSRKRPLLRFYRWDRPSVSIGYMQSFAAAPSTAYAVVRRPTGGGVVYHDRDLTYSVVVPRGHSLAEVDKMAAYNAVNRAVCSGLRTLGVPADLTDAEIDAGVDRRTMVCFRHPTRYDVTSRGRKVAGSAQRRTPAGVLHQGSLHFGGPLPASRPRLIRALCAGFESVFRVVWAPFAPDAELLAHAVRLERERYASEDWTRRR
ncbi:MAG: lipoate--protein ligase family protein [Kiritimatiellaeota bacterium]|nr:lipoate--protein ligase family protein [Kiritimatiellota bacterium]